jgi:hypothetical protein
MVGGSINGIIIVIDFYWGDPGQPFTYFFMLIFLLLKFNYLSFVVNMVNLSASVLWGRQ